MVARYPSQYPSNLSILIRMINQPLRFCMITTFYPPHNFGGDGIFVHRLAHGLAKCGHQVEVIHCIDAYRLLARSEPMKTYDDYPGITVHGLKSTAGFLSPLATYMTGFPFFKSNRIRQILAKGFDVIHYHNISLVGGVKILEYGQGIKLYTMHDYWLTCPNHVMFRFNRAVCTHPYCFLCSLIYKRPPQLWRYFGLLKSAIKQVDAFISPSRFSKHIHHQMGLNIPIVYLPNFVPLAESLLPISDQLVHEMSEQQYFLFVGRLEKLKGLQTLIPVFQHYSKARLLVAGTGNYEHRLRRLARGSKNIRFLGFVSGRKLQALYRKAVAVIFPSLCFEVFTLGILEAFREQTPVIVRDLGAMSEIIKESKGGFVYAKNDELVTTMDRLLANPSYRHQVGMLGYHTYRQEWTAEAHQQRYFELISEIAESRGKSLG